MDLQEHVGIIEAPGQAAMYFVATLQLDLKKMTEAEWDEYAEQYAMDYDARQHDFDEDDEGEWQFDDDDDE